MNPIKSITPDSDIPTTSISTEPQSQPKPATQSSDPSILEELANHYSGELPIFKPNSENASEIASEEVVSESSHQQEPYLEIATNTCIELIIHPEYQSYHLIATHSNISFGIALRKLANKKSSTSNLPTSDDQPSSSENQILVVQPISVAQPSTETTLNPAEPDLVTRELEKKKAEDAATLAKIRELAKGIEVPASSIASENAGTIAQQIVKAAEEVQELVTSEAGSLLMIAGEKSIEEVQKDDDVGSEATASEALRGNPDSLHSSNIIEIESSSESPSTSTSTSTSTSDSFDLDDVPLNKIYTSINKSLSPSAKLKKKPSDEPYEPLYPSVLDRIGEMSKIRVDLCAKLPADHPF